MPTITLSDGEPFDVRTLGLAELDVLAPDPVERYAYKMELVTGDTAYVEFPIERYTEPPTRPDVDEAELKPKSSEWFKFREWQVYQAALQRERERAESVSAYLDAVFAYIIRNCVDPEQAHRIVTDEDWDAVYFVALVPQLNRELLVKILKQTYKASYKDEEVFTALDKVAGGHGIYDACRVWEGELMIAMGMTEEQYALIPLMERGRKVVAMKINEWIGYLEADDHRKKMAAENLIRGAKR